MSKNRKNQKTSGKNVMDGEANKSRLNNDNLYSDTGLNNERLLKKAIKE